MIHLDTNYLIGVASLRSPIGPEVEGWLEAGESIGTSTLAWSEFACGPLTDNQRRLAEAIIEDRIVSFGVGEAEQAAILFNHSGRHRALRVDTFIAATAILSGARLATKDRTGFSRFVPMGLLLA